MNRTDIKQADVFISWTGKDAIEKDRICSYLSSRGLVPLESQSECVGQYLQWSVEAAKSATVFLLLLTKHTCSSKNIPLEILSALTMDDAENRIVVVCENQDIYRTLAFDRFDPALGKQFGFQCETFDPDELHKRKLSVIELKDEELTDKKLEEIAHKTELLIINRAEHIYRERQRPAHMRLASLSMRRGAELEGDFDRLYLKRSVTEPESGETYDSAEVFTKGDGVFFLHGPAGSGKTQYIGQIRTETPENTIVFSLPCAKAAMSPRTLFEDMYEEFFRVLGKGIFYSPDNFRRLIAERHVILILDGMDEIATEKGIRSFLRKVEEYYEPHSKGTTLLFTGRDEKDADMISLGGKRAKKFRLNELTDEEIGALSEELFLLFDAGGKGKEFYVKIKDLNREIKANPLLLTQLAIIYEREGAVPETVVGIFDAISEITFRMDTTKRILEVPDEYEDMIRGLSDILKKFSMERYRLISEGKSIAPVKIFSKILSRYGDKAERAQFLEEYLESRAILIDGEFYHKLFLEYFTAVGYYESCYSDYDELESPETVKALFSHYREGYWTQVLQMFLVKADSLIDGAETDKLYSLILASGKITEYTLLFDTCRDLIRHKQEAEVVCVCDLLFKSAQKIYPPYGPLFWYVPEYALYEPVLIAAERLIGDEKALALARDVCYLYAQKNHCSEITQRVDARALWERACPRLKGVRRALIELFLLGKTEELVGTNVYPRCFNLVEACALEKNGFSIGGRMKVPFSDELELYEHTSFNEFEGECYGLVSCAFDDAFEEKLRSETTRRVTGLAFSPAERTEFPAELRFYCKSVRVLYFPENMTERDAFTFGSDGPCWAEKHPSCALSQYGILYLSGEVAIPGYWTRFKEQQFAYCNDLTSVSFPEKATGIAWGMFEGCRNLRTVTFPDGIKDFPDGIFRDCISLEEVLLPSGTVTIGDNMFCSCKSLTEIALPGNIEKIGYAAFENCIGLKKIILPQKITEIESDTFRGCVDLSEIIIPQGVKKIGSYAFYGCSSLREIVIPAGVSEISFSAFENCSVLRKISIPDGIAKIEKSAFV